MNTNLLEIALVSIDLESSIGHLFTETTDDSLSERLTDENLKTLVITKLGDRKKLLNCFTSLESLEEASEEWNNCFWNEADELGFEDEGESEMTKAFDYFVAEDHEAAVTWFRNAVLRGHTDGNFLLVKSYRAGRGAAEDLRGTVAWYHKAADQGHPSGQASLVVDYVHGLGVRKNYEKGIRLLREACRGRIDKTTYVQAHTILLQLDEIV